MIEVSVKHDFDRLSAQMSDTERRQLPFAAAVALTRMGQALRKDLQDVLRRDLDAPRPFTLNSPFSTSAKRDQLVTRVGIKDSGGKAPPAKYLEALFAGTPRRNKAGERALSALGLLPSGWQVVPGAGVKLDKNGNIPSRTMLEILGALRSGMSVHSGRGKRAATIGYFVAQPGRRDRRTAHLAPGVWRRIQRGTDRAAMPVLLFVRRPDYAQRFDLSAMAFRTVAERWPREFATAFEQARATAR